MTYGYKIVEVVDIHEELRKNHLSDYFEENYSLFDWTVYALIKIGIPKKAEIVIPCESCQLYSSFIKCRCDLAKFVKVEKIYLAALQRKGMFYLRTRVIDLYDITRYMKKEYDINQLTYVSTYDRDFEYKINKYVKPKHVFNGSPFISCASGIHFVNTIEEAKNFLKEVELYSAFRKNVTEEVKINGIFSKDRN